MIKMNSPWTLLFVLWYLAFATSLCKSDEDSYIKIPNLFKSEGKVYVSSRFAENNSIWYSSEYMFTEIVDSSRERSTVDIGTPGRYMNTYDSLPTGEIFSYDQSKRSCFFDQTGILFVLPIHNYVYGIFDFKTIDLMKVKNDHQTGPTGVLELINEITRSKSVTKPWSYLNDVTHRNMRCKKYTLQVKNLQDGRVIDVEMLKPIETNVDTFRDFDILSVKISGGLESSERRSEIRIEYYAMDVRNSADMHAKWQLFRLPPNCFQFLPNKQVEIDSKTSFHMQMKRDFYEKATLVAYDYEAGLLRSDIHDNLFRIWDLNENLLYQQLKKVPNFDSTNMTLGEWSIVQLGNNEGLPLTYKPNKLNQRPTIKHILGLSNGLKFMGRQMSRNMVRLVYQAQVDQLPLLFELDGSSLWPKSVRDTMNYDIVLEFEMTDMAEYKEELMSSSALKEFYPDTISLYAKDKKSGTMSMLDRIVVNNFRWSLEGWEVKSSDMFSVSENLAHLYHGDSDEELVLDDKEEETDDHDDFRLEIAIQIDDLHTNFDNKVQNQELKQVMLENEYRFEYFIIGNIMQLLGVSRMHLLDYEVRYLANHISVELELLNKLSPLKLDYYARIEEPERTNKNYIIQRLSETECVALAPQIPSAHWLAHCVNVKELDLPSECRIMVDGSQPGGPEPTEASQRVCNTYTLSTARDDDKTPSASDFHFDKLHNHEFKFTGLHNTRECPMKGRVVAFDAKFESHPMEVDHHVFEYTASGGQVRSFDTISYKRLEDCERVCDLDAECKSYSYCSTKQQSSASQQDMFKCLVSSLDIRRSQVLKQLRDNPPEPNDNHDGQPTTTKVKVYSNRTHPESGVAYTIDEVDDCVIHERNYLDMYKPSDELVELDSKLALQLDATPSLAECARRNYEFDLVAIANAKSNASHKLGSQFAYCGTTGTCIHEEHLTMSGPQRPKDAIQCRIFKKMYQAYFQVSVEVYANSEPHAQYQESLRLLDSLEDCAKACWKSHHDECVSFDYCGPKTCRLNKLGVATANLKLEAKPSCLHYSREDVPLEKGARERKEAEAAADAQTTTWWVYALTVVLAVPTFVAGLGLGRNLNRKLEAVNIRRQSGSDTQALRPAQGSQWAARVLGYQAFEGDDPEGDATRAGSNSIRMSIINKNHSNNKDDDEYDDEKGSPSSGGAN